MLSLFQLYGRELERLQHLHDSVYQQTQDWYQRLGSRTREQIDRQYGTLPEKEENIQVRALTETFNTTKTYDSVQDSDSCCPLLTILCFCLSGLTQWSGLVLVVAVCPPARPFLQNHYLVSNHTQRPPGTPPHGP